MSWNLSSIYEDDEKKFVEQVTAVINAEDARLVTSEYGNGSRIVSDKLGVIVYHDGSFVTIGSDYKHKLIGGSKLLEEAFARKKKELYDGYMGNFAKYIEYLNHKKVIAGAPMDTERSGGK